MDSAYSKVQYLQSDCDYILSLYGDEGVTHGRRMKRLIGLADKWDAEHGKGFFVRELEKEIKKRLARQ